jgi:hypothetical protein
MSKPTGGLVVLELLFSEVLRNMPQRMADELAEGYRQGKSIKLLLAQSAHGNDRQTAFGAALTEDKSWRADEKTERTTADLVTELEFERAKFFVVALAVGFENDSVFIFGDDADKLEKLNAAIKAGGEPVGFIGIVKDDEACTIYARTLAEYAGDQEVSLYLNQLCENVKTLLQIEIAEKKEGWVN